jgi:hypothetical protein
MDVDGMRKSNLCFNCGKTGHFRRDCPVPDKRTLNVRAIAMELSPEEKNELLATLVSGENEAVETTQQEVTEGDAAMDFL